MLSMFAVLRRTAPEFLSAVATVIAFCVAGAVRGTFPFGAQSRSTGDLGTQIVPMHALARDVITGQAPGDLYLNWTSGLGVPFLPDVATYLGSPLTLLVVLFPRDQVDLAVYAITLIKLAAAAALMTRYLRRVAPGPALGAASLGTAYGLCGWAMDDAAYVPMWLDGFAALPLLALAGEWVLHRERAVLAPLAVTLAWVSNFYTAYMATIAAALLVLARLVVLRWPVREALLGIVRLACSATVGVLLAAPLLVPVVSANRLAQPSPPAVFTAAPWHDLIARLLPATEGVGLTPSLFVTTPVLLLALALPWHRGVSGRIRLVYTGGLVLLILSLQWAPTHLLWHGFDAPNGSSYRQAFVVCAWIVVAAWQAVQRSPGPLAGVAAVLIGGVVLLVGSPSEQTSALTGPMLFLIGTGALVLATVALVRQRLSAPPWLSIALLMLILVDGTVNAVVIDAMRQPRLAAAPAWSDEDETRRAAVLHSDGWPRYRTTPGAGVSHPNAPMLIGGQARSYYSSLMPATTSSALRGLGSAWSGYGRSVTDSADEGLDALLAVGARVGPASGGTPAVRASAAAPLVLLHPDQPVPGGDPFRRRNALLAADAYTLPGVKALLPDGSSLARSGQHFVMPNVAGAQITLVGECPVGSVISLWSPAFIGTAALQGEQARTVLGPGRPAGMVRGAGLVVLGEAPPGTFHVTLSGGSRAGVPVQSVGCLDREVLADAVASLNGQQATVAATGHGFSVTWPTESHDVAIATVTRVRGWQCSTGGPWATPDSTAGFITVPLNGANRMECRFRPPGLRLGLLVGGAGAAGLALLWLAGRRGSVPSPADASRRVGPGRGWGDF